MNKSDSIKELAAALHQAQAEMPAVAMDSKGHYGKYASLGAVIDTTRPVLERHGLSISQFAASENGDVGVTTVLMHTSGEWMESTITLPLAPEERKTLAQVAGSIISYLRRYSWSAVLGLYSDEDTDGGVPAKRQVKTQPNSEGQPSVPRTAQELYAMAFTQLGLQKNHAINIIQNYLDEQHGGGTIRAFIETGADNIKVLWSVLVKHEEAKELHDEPLPF